MTKSEKEFEFEIVRKFDIKDTKPGLLSVYDYYEPMGMKNFDDLLSSFEIINFSLLFSEDALVQQFEISDDCNNNDDK